MADALQNILSTPSTHYSLFEPNQVLASQQLNSLALYLNYQEHLARVKLLGVGIVDGLQVRQVGESVTIRRGVGVTTDGDLVVLATDRTFNHFRLYGPESPRYAPFYDGETMRTVYELVEDSEAESLSALPIPLNDMAVVALVERHADDPDFCTAGDCDNLGKTVQDHLRCLLIPLSEADVLLAAPETVRHAALQLPSLHAARPSIGRGLTSPPLLIQVYAAACTAIHQSLLDHLAALHLRLPALVEEVFGADPTAGWTSMLVELQATMGSSNNLRIQYYYNYLKDLVENWNELREALLADDRYDPVDINAFPRHLMLGALRAPGEFRTGLFSSTLVQGNHERHERAIFLLRKLDRMIAGFSLPTASAAPIRVTPSRTESTSLEERSIPWYYLPEMLQDWNFRLSRRGAADENLGYHISGSEVFGRQIAHYDFFRVEGHQGQNVHTAKATIEKLIADHNLPFSVRAVLLHEDPKKVTVRPSIRYSDLHRLHHLFRKELSTQLNETKMFNERFGAELKNAVKEKRIPERDTTQPALVQQAAEQALRSLSQTNFSDYLQTRQTQDWRDNFKTVVNVSNSFKGTVSDLFRANYATAFDSLLTNNHPAWLEWLESLIASRDELEDEKLLFSRFCEQHPGCEHFGGVARGGTFILLYNENATVIADLMLSYHWPESAEAEPRQPEQLTAPSYKLPNLVEQSVQIQPPLDWKLQGELHSFENQLQVKFKEQFNIQKDQLQFLRDFGTILGNKNTVTPDRVIGNVLLRSLVDEIDHRRQLADNLRTAVIDPATPEDQRQQSRKELERLENELADAIIRSSNFLMETRISMEANSDGIKAVAAISQGLEKVNSEHILSSLKEFGGRVSSPQLKRAFQLRGL